MIVEFIVRHHKRLHGLPPYCNSGTQKAALWQHLATAVTAFGEDLRTVRDIKKKWQDEKRQVKEKYARIELARTLSGPQSGPRIHLTKLEEDLLTTIYPHMLHGLPVSDVRNVVPGKCDDKNKYIK